MGRALALFSSAADTVLLRKALVPLQPMTPHDRRIVHMALADHPQVRTESTGEGEQRRVVIMLRPDAAET